MKNFELIEKLQKFSKYQKVYIVVDGKAKEFEVTWSAVDPSLERPETILLREKK